MIGTPGTIWHFYRAHDLLGTIVEVAPPDGDSWQHGDFAPTPAFETVRPLFVEDLRLLNTHDLDGWLAVYHEIERPGLRLDRDTGGETGVGLVIHIRSTQAWWRF
jgi:hypothetical protein